MLRGLLAERAKQAVTPDGSLRDMVVVLGDDRGLTDAEIAMAHEVGGEAGGGGPVLTASIGGGMLLASHCIVILHHYLDLIHDCPSQLWAPLSTEVRKTSRQIQRRRHGKRREHKVAGLDSCSASSVGGDSATDSSREDVDIKTN